jgi:hypothetical protein
MPGSVTGAADFAALSRRLKEAGETGLRRELYKAISKAAGPLADEISSAAHLRPYMPDRYAETLAADLRVSVSRRTGNDPGVSIRAKGRAHARKLQQLDDGIIEHPLWGNRKFWRKQFGGMRSGFFTDPAEHSAPDMRDAILAAMRETSRKITTGR